MFAGCGPDDPPLQASTGLTLASLDELTVERLRERTYGTTIESVRATAKTGSYLAEYESEGLRVLTRVDVPNVGPSEGGYPILVFLHGWVGIDNAPAFDFYLESDSAYTEIIERYVAAGYVVLTPGFRGHGGADGIEYLAAWDNGSYLSPVFYAVDALNLIDSLDTLPAALDNVASIEVDLGRIFVVGHSQGGDVALIVAAVSGEGSSVRNGVAATSIWSGTFPSRLTQLETYYPMQTTPEAFLAGDGSWNGSELGEDGRTNPNFVFGFPPDWIGTMNHEDWTWQREAWSLETVAEAWDVKLTEMYAALNGRVANINSADYSITIEDSGRASILHDPELAAAIERIGGAHLPHLLTEPLALHFSDRDFYSLPAWNHTLCDEANTAGGNCIAWEYPGTNHSLRVSEHSWFSPAGTEDGVTRALSRDLGLFERISGGRTAD